MRPCSSNRHIINNPSNTHKVVEADDYSKLMKHCGGNINSNLA